MQENSISNRKQAVFGHDARNNSTKLNKCLEWVQEMDKTDMNFLHNCVYVDEARFNINMKTFHMHS